MCVLLFIGPKPKSAHERCVSQCCFSGCSDRKQTLAVVFGFSKLTQDSISNMVQNSKQKCSMSGDNKANVMSLVKFNFSDYSLLFQIYKFCKNYFFFSYVETSFFFHPTHYLIFTRKVFKNYFYNDNIISLCISPFRFSVYIFFSQFNICSLYPWYSSPEGVWCYLCWPEYVTQVSQNNKIMGAKTITAQGTGRDELQSYQREKRGIMVHLSSHLHRCFG